MNRYDQLMREFMAEIVGAGDGKEPIHLSEEDLRSLEAALGYYLPAQYPEFLRDYGCYELFAYFPCLQPYRNEWGEIDWFYGFLPQNYARSLGDASYDISWNYRNSMAEWREELLPVADSWRGSRVCIKVSGDKVGAIYYCQGVGTPRAADDSRVYFVADSFDHFLALLIPEWGRRES